MLLAAKRWLETLPSSGGIPRAQALLTTHAQFSDLTPTQYATALTWLGDVGLLDSIGSRSPAPNRILAAIFEKAAPAWVRDADVLIQTPDELPTDIVLAGEALGLDVNGVFDQLAASWGKVDTAAREHVGAAGELALVALLEQYTDARIDHVSTWSDGFGYDIAVWRGVLSAHIEVKSTTRIGRFTAYLSRHEYAVMLRDRHWVLVALRLNGECDIVGVGSVSREWIAASVPRDVNPAGSWTSCKIEVPVAEIADGIPELGEQVAACLPSWEADSREERSSDERRAFPGAALHGQASGRLRVRSSRPNAPKPRSTDEVGGLSVP